MAAQSIASRSRRPQSVADADDVFLARALQFSTWARKNIRLLVLAAVTLLLLVGALLYYRFQQAHRLERAATEFVFLEQTAAAGNVPLAVRDLELFIQRFDGTPYADEARVLLGRLHLQEGEPQRAADVLSPLGGRIRRSPVGPEGSFLLGAAQTEAGDLGAAIDTYLRVARDARMDFHREEALRSAATLRETQADHVGAAELYRQLVEMAEVGSPERSLYEMRLAEAEGRARGQ